MIRIFHNFDLKILSLLSAIVLWFFVVGIENTVYGMPEMLEVQAKGIDKNVSLVNTLPPVKLYLRVDEEVLKTLSKNDFEVTIDLSEKGSGEYKVPVSTLSKNPQVSVLKVEPAEVDVQLAPVSEKEVSIVAEFSGNPRSGYAIKEVKPETDKVKIRGAQSVIDEINEVNAVGVLAGSETEDVKQTVTLQIPQREDVPKGSVTAVPEQVVISAVIVAETGQKIVPIKPVITGTTDASSFLEKTIIDPPTVTIQGEEKYLKAISELETEPVNAEAIMNRTIPFPLVLVLPENVSLLNQNQNISIAFKSDTNEQKSIVAPIVFTKQNSNFKVKRITPSEIKVTIMGESSVIENLNDDDVTVNINLQNVSGGGSLTIDAKDIIVPSGIEIIRFEPLEVRLETT